MLISIDTKVARSNRRGRLTYWCWTWPLLQYYHHLSAFSFPSWLNFFLKLSQSCFFPPVPIIIPSFLELPSGKHTKSYWKWPSRNSGFSQLQNGWIFLVRYVKLPEGKTAGTFRRRSAGTGAAGSLELLPPWWCPRARSTSPRSLEEGMVQYDGPWWSIYRW